MSKQRPLASLASGIAAHLARFEADPVINARPAQVVSMMPPLPPPFGATFARRTKSAILVGYTPFHAGYDVDRVIAERYLDWLDAGNIGKHTDMPR